MTGVDPLEVARDAAADQAVAAARDAVAPIGGLVTDTRDTLLTVIVYDDGRIVTSSKAVTSDGSTDWRWMADALRRLAVGADRKAEEAGQ